MAPKAWIGEFAPLAELEAGLAQAFASLPVRQAPAGTILFSPGVDCPGFVLILSGSVRVDMSGRNGRAMMLYRVGRAQTCVQTTLCMMGGSSYTAEGVAETDISFVLAPGDLFRRAMGESAAFRSFVFARFAERLADMMRLLETIAFVRVDARLAASLVARSRGGASLAVTHHALAEEVGTAREVVSRQLEAFRAEGLVRLSRGRIEVLDRVRLERLASVT